MRLTQLIYFEKVAKIENITKAAEELYISQPALSKQINQLEAELGVPLFVKKGRNITLSPYGRKLLPYVEESLSQLSLGVDALKKMQQNNENLVSIHLEVGSLFIPGLIKLFQEKYPELQFNISQHSSTKGTNYDYLITSELSQPDNFVELLEEELLVAVPKQHPLAKKETITIKDLQETNVMGLTKQNDLRKALDGYLNRMNIKIDLSHESDDPATLRGLIQAGVGVTFIPSILWQDINYETTLLRPLKEGKMIRTIYLCWPKANNNKTYNKLIIAEIEGFFRAKEAAYYKKKATEQN